MRHKWEKKVNHPYCHERVCVKCGCVKDTTSMTNTIYWMNGEKFFNAPECKPSGQAIDATTINSKKG